MSEYLRHGLFFGRTRAVLGRSLSLVTMFFHISLKEISQSCQVLLHLLSRTCCSVCWSVLNITFEDRSMYNFMFYRIHTLCYVFIAFILPEC